MKSIFHSARIVRCTKLKAVIACMTLLLCVYLHSETLFQDSFDGKNPGWGSYGWGGYTNKVGGGITEKESASAPNSMAVNAVAQGYAGWLSPMMKIPPKGMDIVLKIKMKISADYNNNTPYLWVTWYGNGGRTFLNSSAFEVTAAMNENTKNKWIDMSLLMPTEKAPTNADLFKVILTSQSSKNSAKAAGTLYFDDCIVQSQAKPVSIKGSVLGNWWVLGDTVNFKCTGVAHNNMLTGKVYDSENQLVAAVSVPGAECKNSGWYWKPIQPGFYSVKFHITSDGNDLPVNTSYDFNASINGKSYAKTFVREEHNFAVAPSPTRTPAEISPQFGMHADYLKLSRLTGFHTLRYHYINWDRCETNKGKYNFASVDAVMDEARSLGCPDEQIIFNVIGTPRWASTRDSDKVNICMREYEASRPKNLEDFTDFLNVLAHRYPKVSQWDIWNEPKSKGRSVFWIDSLEDFAPLHKAAYTAIKKLNPNAVIYFSANAHFLDDQQRLLELGCGNYFECWQIHGQSAFDPALANQGLVNLGIPAKPWANLEWHATLLVPNRSAVNAKDEFLTRNMILWFARQICDGAEKVILFETANLVEKEVTQYLRTQNAWWANHTSGLFRRRPYFEPRIMALVWRNFTDLFSGKVTFSGSYSFGQGASQAAMLMGSDAGPILLFWTESDKPEILQQELTAAVDRQSGMSDWEGRTIQSLQNLTLKPNVVYFLKKPDMAVVAKWKNTGKGSLKLFDIESGKYLGAKPTLDESVSGKYRPSPLFTGQWKPTAPETINWLTAGNYISLDGTAKPADFKAEFTLGMNPDGLDLLVRVTDQNHVQKTADFQVWTGDSIQFALDATGEGYPKQIVEFAAGLKDSGPELWKITAPDLGGYLPSKYTSPINKVKFGDIVIEKVPDGLVYKIHIQSHDLNPYAWNKGKIRFSLLVNNSDGRGRAGYVEWASGIGASKDPAIYGTLSADGGTQ